MPRLLLAWFAGALVLQGCASTPPPAPVTLHYAGSSTIARFITDVGDAYPATFTIDTAGESEAGETAVVESAADLGGVAREPRASMLDGGVRATLIGRDAIAIVVHADLPVDALSLDELARLFEGEIGDWSELGGPALPVKAFVVGEESATHRVLRGLALGGRPIVGAEVVRPDGDLVARVAATPGGVGAISFSFLEGAPGVRAVGVEGELPDVANFDYPLARPLHLLWRPGDGGVESFVAWCTGEAGQRVLMRRFVGTGVVGSVGAGDEAEAQGSLVVRTETLEVLEGGVPYYPHRPYEVHTRHGEFLRRVRNHRSPNDERPTRISLSPGVYLVRTETRERGPVEFFVTITVGRTTELDVAARLEEGGE